MAEQNFLAPGPTKAEFDTLNGTVSGLADQMAKQSHTIYAGQNVTIVSQHCYIVGNLVCLNVSFTMGATAGSTDYLITGLPTAASEVPVIAVRNLTYGGSQAVITTGGNLKNSWDSFENGKTYFINCCYAKG